MSDKPYLLDCDILVATPTNVRVRHCDDDLETLVDEVPRWAVLGGARESAEPHVVLAIAPDYARQRGWL